MADTSDFSVEERLVASVWVHERWNNNKTMKEIISDFVVRFGKAPPSRPTLLTWEKKAFATGSVRDAPRTGRPSTRADTCAAVAASVEQSPQKSTRKRSSELGIPRSTMQEHMKKDLHLSCFRPSSVSELSDVDLDRRVRACELLLQNFPTVRSKKTVMFTDECAIYRSFRNRNIFFWAKENPYCVEEIEQNPPHVMIWAGMTAEHLIGPYFFDGSVNAVTYLTMINEWMLPELQSRGIADTVWFQQDGAPAHFALNVRERLNEIFPGRWIGRGSERMPAPLPWPARSPDLSTPDNALWGIVKQHVQQKRYISNEQLKDAVRAAFQMVSPDMLLKMNNRTWRRIRLCHEHGGTHTGILD